MRVVVLVSTDFRGFAKAFNNQIKKDYEGAEVVALATTRRVYNDLKLDPDCDFYMLDCLEDREIEWLEREYDPQRLQAQIERFGADMVNGFLIADRQVGASYVQGARNIQTKLFHETRDDKKLRAYITHMIDYCDDLITTHKADSVFLYAIAGAYSCALGDIFQKAGLSAYRLQHCRVDNLYILDPNLKGMLDPLWVRFDTGESGKSKDIQTAEEWLLDFREKSSKEPDYMGWVRDTIAQNLAPTGIIKNIVRSFVRAAYFTVYPQKQALHTETRLFKILEAFRYPWYYRKAAKWPNLLGKDDLNNRDFVYYPLHLDPEASTMYLSPDYTDQHAVLEALSKQRPLNQDIIVKENPFMLGRRPKGYYEFIQNLPGVYIADPAIAGIELVQKCSSVLTLTSTTAWEAMLLGKPSVVLGAFPFLRFEGNITPCASLNTIGEALRAAYSAPAVNDEDIVRFLSLIYEESFGFNSTVFWGNVDDETVKQNHDVVENMVSQFIRRYLNDTDFQT